jgi:hypothetical protein
VGRIDVDGWSANTAADSADHMAYGPYATTWGGGAMQAVFHMMVDDNTFDDGVVVKLEAHDAMNDQTFATREVHRKEFKKTMTYQRFTLDADLAGRGGHQIETRVWYGDIAYVRLQKIVVNTAD